MLRYSSRVVRREAGPQQPPFESVYSLESSKSSVNIELDL